MEQFRVGGRDFEAIGEAVGVAVAIGILAGVDGDAAAVGRGPAAVFDAIVAGEDGPGPEGVDGEGFHEGGWLRRGWPDDAAFHSRLADFPIYRRESRKCRLILERLEQSYGHKEKVDVSTLSIEHVMPQTIDKGKHSKAWQVALGDQWRTAHERRLHSLGNLTLSGYNSNLSNRAYAEKRSALATSNLVLNQWFEKHEEWCIESIDDRSKQLASEVGQLWPRPDGGSYTPPSEIETATLTKAERGQQLLDYWSAFLALAKGKDELPRLPKPARRGLIGFPTGTPRFRFIALANVNRRYVGISLVCRGPKAKENFEQLRSDRAALYG